jgi:hypothetical protein
MINDEKKEWLRFEYLALGRLDSSIGRQNFVGLSIDPSFENKERLFVSKVKKGLRWTYRTWDSAADYEKLHSTAEEKLKMKFGKQEPTIYILEGDLGLDSYKLTDEIIDNLSLKSLVEFDGFGLDGISYTISIGNYLRETRYSWWVHLPDEWNGLAPIFQELQNNLDLARISLVKKLAPNTMP